VPAAAGAVYRPLLETVPPLADQLTAVLVLPVTVAVNCCEAPTCRETELGAIDTTTGAAEVTVTVATADLLLSATLVAVTVNVPAVPGAVYSPLEETVPPLAVQLTAVLAPFAITVAVNGWEWPTCRVAESGAIVTATTGGGLEVTVTVAEAVLVLSAALVAVTVKVPGVLGAVYKPLAEMLPPLVDQLTAALLVPLTLAANCRVLLVCREAVVGEMAAETEGGTTSVEAAILAVVTPQPLASSKATVQASNSTKFDERIDSPPPVRALGIAISHRIRDFRAKECRCHNRLSSCSMSWLPTDTVRSSSYASNSGLYKQRRPLAERRK
jgi:hypothetical protein